MKERVRRKVELTTAQLAFIERACKIEGQKVESHRREYGEVVGLLALLPMAKEATLIVEEMSR